MADKEQQSQEGRRRRPPPVSEINTRPMSLTSKKGATGQPVKLQANYFKLTSVTDWCLYQYRVDIAPEESRTFEKKRLLRVHREKLKAYMFDGTVLYTSHRLPQPLELDSIREEDHTPIKITIKLVGDLVRGDYHYFQFFNMIVRKSLEQLKLQLVGRDYYDAASKVEIKEFRLELWPGYITSIRQHERGILMCAEISHKVMRDQTLRDILEESYRKNARDYQRVFVNTVIGGVVLTDYNNRTYRIDDVDFSKHPSDTFEQNGRPVSYADYYKQKYQITIKDLRQPLLVSRSKARDRRAGQDEIIYLIPELCRSTGLTDDMRSNFQLMKALADHTRIPPNLRIQRLLNFNRRLTSKPEIVQDFARWQFQLDSNLVELPGRVLPPEQIFFGSGKTITPRNADWNFEQQDNPVLLAGELKDWVAIVPQRNLAPAKEFLEATIRAAAKIKFNITRPALVEIPDDRTETYVNAITKVLEKRNPQLIFFVVPNNQLQRYSVIKKKLCIERPIPSQVVLQRTLTQKKQTMLNAVGCKVAVQLNCKIGGIPWALRIGQLLPGLMVVGFDVCHDKTSKNGDFGAMVASLDQNFGRYFSAVSQHNSGEELSNDMALHLGRALEEFKRINNNRLPSNIIIYRDGVGEGQIPFVHEYEVTNIKKMLAKMYGETVKFKLAFVIVTKRINTRFFLNSNNPPPGTVIDDVVTDPLKYDFFIVSQSVRQGTVAPTSYNVIEDTTGLPADKMQQLTYKLCHLYYNFSGTVRVPAPCQYAHKLAFFVSQALHATPHQRLEKLLYFL